MASEPVKVTKGMLAVARWIDTAGLTWKVAATQAGIDASTLGTVLRGKGEPAPRTMSALRSLCGTDANLWLEEATADERADWLVRMESMRRRAVEAVHGPAAT